MPWDESPGEDVGREEELSRELLSDSGTQSQHKQSTNYRDSREDTLTDLLLIMKYILSSKLIYYLM